MERIFAVVKAKGGFHHFNVMVVGKMRGWVEETARTLVMEVGVENGQIDQGDALTIDQLDDLSCTANLLADGGKLDEAQAMYVRALAGCEEALGPDHTSTLFTTHNLANVLYQQGNLDEAKAMYERALVECERVSGPDHANTLFTVSNLAALLSDQGKLDEAKAMYERALSGQEKVLGPDHTSTLSTVNNLAMLLQNQGNCDVAKAMYDRALVGQEKALGPDHPDTINTIYNLAALLKDQGKFNEAQAMYIRALAKYEKVLGPDHTRTINTVLCIGASLSDQGKWDEAEVMYDRALVGYEKVVGPDHVSTLRIVNNLGLLLKQQGKLDEAKVIYERALQACQEVLEPGHKTIRHLTECLEDCEPFQVAMFPTDGVALKQHRNVTSVRIFSDYRVRFNNFNTVIGDVHLFGGKYYYEVEVLIMNSTPQFGWATEGFERTEGHSGNGVGDDTYSWGFDGDRIMKWYGGKQPFGKVWTAGDVLGLAIDLVGKTVSFSVNGYFSEPLGVAFSGIDVPAGWIMPALSSQTGTYHINFGDRCFIHPPPDKSYQSVALGMQRYK